MDTYFNTNHKCETCGKCVKVCPEQFLVRIDCKDFDGDDFHYITGVCDYVPCHHCDGFWEDKTPCQVACPNGAIELSRW